MSKANIIFSLKGYIQKYECNINSYLREQAKKFALSIGKDIAKLYFVGGLKKININSKIKEIKEIKNNNEEIEINVYEKEEKEENNIIKYRVTGKEDKIQIFGEIFVANNKKNFKIILDNNKEYELFEFYDLKKYSEYIYNKTIQIKLKQINEVTDLSMMFQSCRDLISLPDLSFLNIENVTDISYMFSNCSSLLSLPDLSSWNTSKVNNMSSLFYGCSSLTSLSDISYWDTSNVTDMSFLFYNCSSLKSLPDISKWDTGEVTDMSYMFYNCSSLNSLPDISKLKITNLLKIENMLTGCSSLKNFPDLSKWANQILINKGKINMDEKEIDKNTYIQMINDHFFLSCKNCKSIPEILLKDDDTILLKCNKCGISESEKIEKICNFSSLWVNEIVHNCTNSEHRDRYNIEARKYCKTCDLFLCRECLNNHKERKNNHEYVEIKDINFNYCNSHKQEITYYCKTCDLGICNICNKEHLNHDIKSIMDINIDDKDDKDENNENKNDENEKENEKEDKNGESEDNNDDKKDRKINEDKKKKEKRNKNRDEKKNEEKKEKINNKILNLFIFEKFLRKTKETIDEKDKVIKDILSLFEVLQEQDNSLKKAFEQYSNDFNDILYKDNNFLNLSKVLFISCKKENNENISNYKEVINILKNKFVNEEMEKFKEYIYSKKEEFLFCTQKLTENEKDKLKNNIDFQFKPPNKNISDEEKTKKFIAKNIESTKIAKKHIIIDRIKNPDNYINVENTIKNPKNIYKPLNSRENRDLVLSLFGKSIKNKGVEVLVSKTNDKEFKNMELASLNSLITLGDKKNYELYFDYGEEKNKEIINNELEKEKLKYIFKSELSSKLNITKDEIIVFIEEYEDIVDKKKILKFQFTIPNQTKDFTEEINKYAKENKNIVKTNMKQIIDAIKISPALLDPNGDKYQNWSKNKNKIRGGEQYISPSDDWYGIGLNVKNKYENNEWLENKNKKGEYAIAYLGINTFLKNKEQILKDTKSYTDKISNMIDNKLYQFETNVKVKGFCCELCGPKCGEGVCLFQNPEFAENSAGIIDISGIKFKIMLMCRVNPLKIRQPKSFQQCWILNPTTDEIRPYRILIKKIPSSPLKDSGITTSSSPVDYITSAIFSNNLIFLQRKNDRKFSEYAKIGGQTLSNDFFAIRLYTSDYYKYINNYLRDKNSIFGNEFTEEEIISWIYCLQLALTRNINVEDDIIVYRGIRGVKFSSNIGIGSKFYFREFVSTSKKRSVAEDFLQGNGTLLTIKIKNNGTNELPNYCYYIEDITYIDGEFEVLFCSHCFFSGTNIQHKKEIDYDFLNCEGYVLKDNIDDKNIKMISLNS